MKQILISVVISQLPFIKECLCKSQNAFCINLQLKNKIKIIKKIENVKNSVMMPFFNYFKYMMLWKFC